MNLSWKRNLYVLWTGVFFCSMAFSMSVPFLSLFISDELHVETHLALWAGVSFGITFLASALIAPFWGSLSDKYGRKPMLLRSGFALCAIYVLTSFVHNPYELIAVRILSGLLAGYVPAAIALVGTKRIHLRTRLVMHLVLWQLQVRLAASLVQWLVVYSADILVFE